ncbi:hypothetical protein D3C85_808060 [compost metagenome]
MGRAAATPHRAAATVEQQQLDLLLAADIHQSLLRPVLRPGRRGGAGVLGRVGVADHHFLRPLQARAIARQQQQLLDHRPRVVEVGQGFEQRHHAHRPQHAGLFEQQLHGEYIRSRTGHGDHIGTEGCRRRSGDFPAGRQHLGGVGARFEVVRQQGPTIAQFAHQEGDALLLAPVLVASQAEVVGDFGHRGGVPRRVLAYIQTNQEQTECHCPTQAIEQRPIGDHAHAALVQGAVAKLQWIEQFAVVLQHIDRCRRRRRQGGMCPVTRCPQAFAQVFEHCPVRLGAVSRPGLQFIAGLLHRQLSGQAIDIAQVQIGRHPARQQ